MPAARTITITSDRLLLVEGRDEQLFCEGLLAAAGKGDIQVEEYRGEAFQSVSDVVTRHSLVAPPAPWRVSVAVPAVAISRRTSGYGATVCSCIVLAGMGVT